MSEKGYNIPPETAGTVTLPKAFSDVKWLQLKQRHRRRKRVEMYYDIVESGIRIRKLRTARHMTRQNLADEVGLSVDALRKIERGTNGAKIDTLVSISERLGVSLDYLVCGCEKDMETDVLFAGLKETEKEFIRSLVLHAVENMGLLRS